MPKSYPTFLAMLVVVLLTSACSSTSLKKLNAKLDEVVVHMKPDEPGEKSPPSSAVSAQPVVRKAGQDLNLGIRNYEDGNYSTAASHFQNALGDDALTAGEQVTAHKFLAFIYCISGEKLACRGEFKKVLLLNPKFELSAGETGHPIWGPVFRDVQAEVSRKARKN